MANSNDKIILNRMLCVPDEMQAEFFRQNAHLIDDDSLYWNVLGTMWKLGGTVIQQELWIEMFTSSRPRRHKIMKNSERSVWRRLPRIVKAYRAINDVSEIETAISWTLDRKVAEKFSANGKRQIVERHFNKKEIFAYFNRRRESEILVNITRK